MSTPTAPIVLVHGFLGDQRDWQPVRDRLGAQYTVTSYELPGHGANPPLNDEQPWFAAAAAQLAQTLREAADNASGTLPILAGYSMGGRLALFTAVHHPALLRALVCIAADPGIEDDGVRHARSQRDRELAERLRGADRAAFQVFLDEWYSAPLFGGLRQRPDHRGMLQRRLEQRPADLAAALVGLSVGRQPVLWPQLPQLPMPCVYLAGADDQKYCALGSRLAGGIASGTPQVAAAAEEPPAGGWRCDIAAGAAHAVHIERPALVVRWLQALSSSQ